MRLLLPAAVILSVVLPLSAQAQTTRLPSKSRSERQVEEINRNIQQDRRLQSLEQEIEVRNNQLRQNIDRDRMFANPPPIPVPPLRRSTCPAGSMGCP